MLVCFIIFSCTKDSDDERNSGVNLGKITNIESLKNITLGETDTIVITFNGGDNGCAHPDHLEASITSFTIVFRAYYNYPIEPTICPENVPIHTLQYIFKPTSIGIYTYESFNTEVESKTEVN